MRFATPPGNVSAELMIIKFRTEEMSSLETLTFTNPPDVENSPGERSRVDVSRLLGIEKQKTD